MKILVTVGTQNHDFNRLFKYVDKYLSSEEIISQYGYTNYEGTFDFTHELIDYIKESDLIITHGGVGTIMECLKHNKKVIVVPRLKEFNEHVDDHQLEITNKLVEGNYIFSAKSEEEFENAIKNIEKHVFKSYESNNEHFNNELNEVISKL